MTSAETCTVLVDTVRELSATRAECESWRLVALASMQHSAELARELAMVDERQYIHRRRLEDERDIWLDHRDLRQEAA